jgi:hypothetical protein
MWRVYHSEKLINFHKNTGVRISELLITTAGKKSDLIYEFESLGLIKRRSGGMATKTRPILKILK